MVVEWKWRLFANFCNSVSMVEMLSCFWIMTICGPQILGTKLIQRLTQILYYIFMITAIIWFLVCFQLHWFYLAGLFSLNYLPVSHEFCCPKSFWFSFPIHETNSLRLSRWWFEPVSIWSDSSFTFFLYCIHLKQVTRSSQYSREGVNSGGWTSGVRGLWETH